MVAGAKISVTNKRRLLWGKVLQWIILGFAVLTMAQFGVYLTISYHGTVRCVSDYISLSFLYFELQGLMMKPKPR